MKFKGGSGFLVTNGVANDVALRTILQQPTTRVNYKDTVSSGGILFDINYDPSPNILMCDTTGVRRYNNDPDNPNIVFKNSSHMLLKVILTKVQPPRRSNERYDILNIDINVNGERIQRGIIKTDPTEAINEVNLQQQIFAQSFDQFLEPICPMVFYSCSLDDLERQMYIDRRPNLNALLMDKSDVFREIYNSFIDTPLNNALPDNLRLSMHFLFMEVADYGQPQPAQPVQPGDIPNSGQVGDVFPTSRANPLPPIDTPEKEELVDALIFEVYRLWKLGFVHGDLHLDNAMYVKRQGLQYIYQNRFRVFIIDFGRTEPHGDDINDIELFKRNATVNYFWSYRFIYNVINRPTTNNAYLQDLDRRRDMIKMHFSLWIATHSEALRMYLTNVPDLSVDRLLGELSEVTLSSFRSLPAVAIPYLLNIVNTENMYHIGELHYISFRDTRFYAMRNTTFIEEVNLASTQVRQIRTGGPNNFAKMTDNHPNDYGIYNWILVVDMDGILNMYFSRVVSRFQAGVQHEDLVRNAAPRTLISAGQMTLNAEHLRYNLTSTRFMQDRFGPNITENFIAVEEATYITMRLIFGVKVRYPGDATYMTEEHFTEDMERDYLRSLGERYRSFDNAVAATLHMSTGGRNVHLKYPNREHLDLGKIEPNKPLLSKPSLSKTKKYNSQHSKMFENAEHYLKNPELLLEGFRPLSAEEYKKVYELSLLESKPEQNNKIELIPINLNKSNLDYLDYLTSDKEVENAEKIHGSICGVMQAILKTQMNSVQHTKFDATTSRRKSQSQTKRKSKSPSQSQSRHKSKSQSRRKSRSKSPSPSDI